MRWDAVLFLVFVFALPVALKQLHVFGSSLAEHALQAMFFIYGTFDWAPRFMKLRDGSIQAQEAK
jgi:hypothetical protein